MPADRRRPKPSKTTSVGRTIVNNISGGKGGNGGDGNGAGGAGGNGTGPSLSFDISAGNLTMNNLQQDGERGIDILHRSVALAAIHNSAESFPQPRCHPETRTGILKGLRGWALDDIDDMHSGLGPCTFRLDGPADPECRILWVFGPAGAGKSAIMQTLAGQLQDAGQLGASFFFKRGHVTRGNARTLFATIAYQLALSVSCLRTSVSQIVENDPSIIVRSLEVQMQKLISEPLRDHGNRDSVTVIIDGLDECEGYQAQAEVLRTIKNLFSNNSIPLRFIIASRPEAHIREVLDSPPFLDVRRFNVEQSFDDVRRYLCDEFARIHREHRIMANVPSPWPTPDILDKLVWKSSGHFIYAATIIKFIDDKNYRPTQRLGIVQDNNTAGSASAFSALDQLYMAILGSVPRQAELVPILRAIANFDLYLDQLDELLGLEDGEAGLLLRGLHSVLNVQSDEVPRLPISRHHASFLDFLNDPGRSHHFYVGGLDHRMALAQCFLRVFAGRDQPIPGWSIFRGMRLISFLIALPPSAELCPLIACLDPDWIFETAHQDIESMVSWLKRIPSPQDLINLWEDYVFMSLMRKNDACSVKHILSPSPELCRVLVITVFLDLPISWIRELLDITWTEFRTILCTVQPNLASDAEQVLRGSAKHVVHASIPPETQQTVFRELASRCIDRVIKSHGHNGINGQLEWYYLSMVLKHCPPCDILYHQFESIPIDAMLSQSSDRDNCERICEWLKSFSDPTLGPAFLRKVALPWEWFITQLRKKGGNEQQIQMLMDQLESSSFSSPLDS